MKRSYLMGFFINEITYELKQHLNLSEKAWDTIYGDMRNFYGEEEKQSFSGFLNRIFYNYYQEAEGSIGIRCNQLKEELICLSEQNRRAFSDSRATEKMISVIISKYENELYSKAVSYPKGLGKKFRVNRQNLEILKDSDSSDYYDDSIGTYMKAVFEEYVTLSSADREGVFFKDTIESCNYAISQRKKIKISLQQRISPKDGTTYARRFYVAPYKVVSDKMNMFNYLIGISEEILSDGSLGEKRISSFRISRIDKISVMNSMSGFLSQQKIDEINKELQKKPAQYMAGDLIDIEVVFTKKGLESFERHIYLRPTDYKRIDTYSYIFTCTELQAIHYFFKFGKDAVIKSPVELNDKFRNYYKEALCAYE